MQRRRILLTLGAGLLAPMVAPATRLMAAGGSFEVNRTTAEWKAMLTPLEYAVMREESTEKAFSSPLHDSKAKGTYLCRGCELPLYSSKDKFDSGTGWPSFTRPLDNAIETKTDRKLLFLVRTECHCRRCGSHLGHIFDDGPPPTGMRHCLNGVSLVFQPA
ncbi:peptide-methionine (R)-S-oxide reductase MsrB [Seohaeicola nanhaiensis]|uniref:peptide-methionine (R)-S-oxide reductase n=1 Tax=Seohaeicola nanhaiensis TaxID=1387282 RepID=A0ABV9KJL3_9RHOB